MFHLHFGKGSTKLRLQNTQLPVKKNVGRFFGKKRECAGDFAMDYLIRIYQGEI